MLLWEWNEIRCGKALLKILKSHPQVRSYYIPAHPEVKSLEVNFRIKLLGSGSSHHVVLLSLPTHTGKESSVTCRGMGCRRSLGRLFSWKDNGLRDALIVEQRVDTSRVLHTPAPSWAGEWQASGCMHRHATNNYHQPRSNVWKKLTPSHST